MKEKEKWKVMLKPVEHQPVIVNTKTKEEYDLFAAVCRILNSLEEED